MKSTVLRIICICLLLVSCNEFDSGVQYRLFGLVTDQNNQSLRNAQVDVSSNNGFVLFGSNEAWLNTFFTNDEGRFEAFLPGVLQSSDNYTLIFRRSVPSNLASVFYHVLEEDFQNKTLQIPTIRLFPVNAYVSVLIHFNITNPAFSLKSIHWQGDAITLGSLITSDNTLSNRVVANSTFTLRYTVFNETTNQEQTFEVTRTVGNSEFIEVIVL
jgi:hypothetical protein